MKTTSVRTLAALAIGCAAGWNYGATGCGTANADEPQEVEVKCDQTADVGGQTIRFGVLELPGRSWDDILVSVWTLSPVAAPSDFAGSSWYDSAPQPIRHARDGAAFIDCGNQKTRRVLVH